MRSWRSPKWASAMLDTSRMLRALTASHTHNRDRQMLRRGAIALVLLAHGAHAHDCDGGKTIPDTQVNDDYCDCLDGSDEPATGACGSVMFECPSKPHRPVSVFASRVNDGICDCCDGADEWRKGGCPNTCVDLAKSELAVQSKAALLRGDRERAGKEAAKSRTAQLKAARRGLEKGAAELTAALHTKAAAEAIEAERMADRQRRLDSGEVAESLKVGALSDSLLHVALARLVLAKQVRGAELLHDTLSTSPTVGAEMADVDS